ncbi:hypothetical protein [Tropicimonas aquimaris]|uniref:Uncharacterized protein n=1 Tax=Tropicimonas aquimaris TaxID=914152 RepID=A0ABW3IJ33_9RHOB
METIFLPRRDWVLSGSMDSWSEGIDHRFTLAVFLDLDTESRLARLSARERARVHTPDEAEEVLAFLEWAAAYDDGLLPGRNRARHTTWASELSCPVLTLNSTPPVEELVSRILAFLGADAVRCAEAGLDPERRLP